MSATAGGFVLTPALINHVRYASLTGASLALALCFFVCLTAAWVYSVPSARHHLDRVSFRLFMCSMGMEVVYTACFIVLTQDANLVNSRTSCGAMVYLLLATMGVCNWLCTCIGLNLMLAISCGINPLQYRLERWYILGSIILGFGVPLVPAILGHFGLDPNYNACYFTQGNKTLRIKDFVLDLYFWQLLSCAVAAVSVFTVLITLLRRSRATERALFQGNSLDITSAELREITTSTNMLGTPSESHPSTPHWYHRLTRTGTTTQKRSHMHRLQDKLATIALKISLYPITLLFINIIITAEDLSYTSRGGLFSTGEYAMYWLHNFLYGGRGLFFALLGIIVDPCLRLGVPAAWRATFSGPGRSRQSDHETGAGEPIWDDAQSITNFLSTTGPESDTDLKGSLQMVSQVSTVGSTARRGSPAGWFSSFRSGRRRSDEVTGSREGGNGDMEVLADEKAAMDGGKEVLGYNDRRPSLAPLAFELGGPGSGPVQPPSGQGLSITIDPPTQSLPVRFSPSPTPPGPFRIPPLRVTHSPAFSNPEWPNSHAPSTRVTQSPTFSNPEWIQPLAEAVLTRATSRGQMSRRSSDPELGVTQRRKKELQLAAEELYAQAQLRL